jgi:hypothetical protein
VAGVVSAHRSVPTQRAGHDETHRALGEHMGGAVAQAGLQAGVRDAAQAEGVLEEERGLGGVADPQRSERLLRCQPAQPPANPEGRL